MSRNKLKPPDVRLIVDDYYGSFYKKDKLGHWRKFDQIGNAGIALSVADLLRKLGHQVEVIEESLDDV